MSDKRRFEIAIYLAFFAFIMCAPLVLEPGLRVYKIYNGYWFWGRPSIHQLWADLQEIHMRIKADFDPTTPPARALRCASVRIRSRRPSPNACSTGVETLVSWKGRKNRASSTSHAKNLRKIRGFECFCPLLQQLLHL